jgi:GH18 family chitinase
MKNFVFSPKHEVFTQDWVNTIFTILFSLVSSLAFSQTTTYAPAPSSWTTSPTTNIACAGTLLGKTIKDRVSISGSNANFEVAKVSGTFTANGVVYIKDAACGNILTSISFSKGASSVFVSLKLSHTSGSKNYVATLNSSTGDKFYTNPITITATTTPPPTTLSVSPTSLSFPSAGGTKSITITSNASCKVSGSVNGFTVNQIASNRIDVTASANENPNATTSPRSGSFTIIAGSGSNTKSQKIDLSQDGKVYVPPSSDFKIIGYLPTYQWGISDKTTYLQMLTHVNVAFINPKIAWNNTSKQYEVQFDTKGNVILEFEDGKTSADLTTLLSNLNKVTSTVTGKKLSIFVALAGARGSESLLLNYKYLLSTKELRLALINSLLTFVKLNNCVGVDVDLEYNAMKLSNYNIFVQELSTVFKANGKLTTAAVEAKNGMPSYISSTTLDKLDWINQMSYDEQTTDQHAPLTSFQNDFKVWNTDKKLIASKIVMGLPFYGHLPLNSRKNSNPEISFFDVYNSLSSNKNIDYAKNVWDSHLKITHKEVYYNGVPTIATKTKTAKTNKCGGVMIWSLGSDKYDDINNSLLKAIYDAVLSKALINKEEGSEEVLLEEKNPVFYAYPNPAIASNWINFNKEVSFQILDEKTSQIVLKSKEAVKGCNISNLRSGRYIIQTNEGEIFRIIK